MRLFILVTAGLILLSACSGAIPGGPTPQPTSAISSLPTSPTALGPDISLTAGAELVEPATPVENSETATAQGTPTPEVSPTPGPCGPGDLFGEVRTSSSAGGPVTFTVSLTAAGNKTCLLYGPPQVALVSRQGVPLDVDFFWTCYRCGEGGGARTPAETTTAAPAANPTEAAQEELNRIWVMKPQDSVRVLLVWSNWCYPLPPGGVSVRMLLAGGNLDLPTDAEAAGRCTAENQRSTVLVSQFYQQ